MYYSTHPFKKTCEFCGDEFDSHHGLQRYCPEKFGRKDYCKYAQKNLVNERKLAELVNEIASAVKLLEPIKSQLTRNIEILKSLIQDKDQIVISSTELEQSGFKIGVYNSKIRTSNSKCLLVIGNYSIDWIDYNGKEFKFIIKQI